MIALARYTSFDNEDGEQWPQENEWRAQLLAKMAAALERIAKS